PVAAHSLRGRDGVGGTGGARARRRTVGERLTAVSASLATKPSTGTQVPGGRPAPLHRPAALGALWLGGLVALLVSVAVVITIGPSGITAGDVVQSALARVTGADSGLSRIQEGIIWNLRLPRSLMAALAGAGLALCG